ncbi:MAG: hypothetical protein H7099_16395 [Gemmatimonadaceae bacterium]|nr:hypothetical protein [Gemmatimonadaceae bacterium]
MIAGLLALTLVSADTTMRIAPPLTDSVMVSVLVAADTSTVPLSSGGDSLHLSATRPMPRAGVTDSSLRLLRPRADTTIRKKRALVEYSDWYGRRVTIHKTLSWAMLPLFAVSYYTGEQLAREGRENVSPWIRKAHPYVATADAAIFGINTVTGLWNLWDSRRDPQGRVRRIVHSVLFIAADAGFAYAGSIGRDGRENGEIRSRHRTIALSSMGVSTVGWLIMLIGQ